MIASESNPIDEFTLKVMEVRSISDPTMIATRSLDDPRSSHEWPDLT
jgi:hypothetical protein